jgi:ubiquinone/menaquinone biosynthesis C-methylase UbiE
VADLGLDGPQRSASIEPAGQYDDIAMLSRFIAKQLANPSPVIGQLVLAPIWNRRNAALNDAAFAAMELAPQDAVLEVGFGGGYLLGRILEVVREGTVAGVDKSAAMVSYCRNRYRSQIRSGRLVLHCGAGEHIPFGSGNFTKVCAVNSLFYWEDAGSVLSEVFRVLKEGAEFVLCFTDRRSLEAKAFTRQGMAHYEIGEVQSMLESAGFGVVDAVRRADKHREYWCVRACKG